MVYDLAVIGAGWAGFNACLKARKLGLQTVLIDRGPIGGTCLNKGCIPTKVLIQSAKIYSLAKKTKNFGVEVDNPRFVFADIQSRKEKIIQQLRAGMQFALKGADFINEEARIMSPGVVSLSSTEIRAKNTIIATGSRPADLPGFTFDGTKIFSSDDVLNLKELPKSILIIGGGVIGCEFASLFNTLGVEVTLAEKIPQLLPAEDKDVVRKLEVLFRKKGIKVFTGVDVSKINRDDFEMVLVCVGRKASAYGLGIDIDNLLDDRGRVQVDGFLRTGIPGIFAAGDCTGKLMLAHYASYQGEIAAFNCAHPEKMKTADNTTIPNCIYTDPEIASCGLNEEAALAQGIHVEVEKFDFLGSGMARIIDETEGFIKIVSESGSEKIIGASIIGPRATELIGILNLSIQLGLTRGKLKETIFAHPTVSESIKEALA